MPTQDAWLSDSISEYVAYLALESAQGESAFLEAMNRSVLPEAQFTLPGGLEITSDATLFTQSEYDTVVRGRGALVFHELRVAMELEPMLAGLKRFYEKGLSEDILGEYDLIEALDEASGGDWEAFLTDWLFNVADYYEESYTLDSIE